MPIPVDYKGLATLEFPDDWSEERIREHVRVNEPSIRKKIQEALNSQGAQETAEDPENAYLTPMEALGVGAINVGESAARTAAAVPGYLGRVAETLPPGMMFGGDDVAPLGPQAQQFIADLERQRAGESPEALRSRIETNPMVRLGKEIKDAAESDTLNTIPRSRENFWSGQVAQGIGTTVAGVGAGLVGGPAAGMAMMFGAEAEDAWDEEMQRQAEAGERYNPDKALLKSLGYGAFATAVESKLGTGRLTKLIQRQFGGTTREAVKKASELGALPKFLAATVKEAGAGFTEESIQRLGQSLIVSEGKELDVEGAVREGLVGVVAQGGLAIPANVVESRRGADPGRLPSTGETVSRMAQAAGPNAAIVEPPDLTAEDLAAIEGEITGVEEAVAAANRPDETKPAPGAKKGPSAETVSPPAAMPEAEPGTAEGTPEAEAPNAILEQLRLTADPESSKAATLIANGTETPEFDYPGLMQAKTKHGLVVFNPDKIGPDEIAVAASGDVFDGLVLGMATTAEVAPKKSAIVVSTSTPAARNVVTELVDPNHESIAAAQEAQQAAVPGGTTEVKPAAQVVAERREDRGEPISPPSPQPGPVAGEPQQQQAQPGVVAPAAAGGVVAPPVTTFEEFEKEYRKAFAQSQKYTPDQIGFGEASARMAELADAHPEWLDKLEAAEEAAATKPAKGGVPDGLQGQKEEEGPVLKPAQPAPKAETPTAPAAEPKPKKAKGKKAATSERPSGPSGPAAPSTPERPSGPSEMEKAKADAAAALDDILEILGGKKNIVSQEQEAKLLVALTRLFDAGFRMGYLKFKEVAKWALEQIRAKSTAAADDLTIDHLQGAYIAMAGRHQGKGADTKGTVIAVANKEAIYEPDTTELPGSVGDEQPGSGQRVEGERGARDEAAGGRGQPGGSERAGPSRPDDAPERVGDGGGVRSDAVPAAGNYRITDEDRIGDGGLKGKFRDNIEAIKTLKKIESENRGATAEEQAKLVRYVGWGAMGGAFGEVDSWEKEAAELRALLTAEEYAEARRSTLDAFYTSPTVVRAIHSILSRFGFTGGKMVEGGVGVGHFIGLMPDSWKAATHYTGVEKDGMTARIAGKLYPQSRIVHSPFEKVDMARDYFDASTGNPPFGQQRLFDPHFKEESSFSIHNYFIAKQISLLRPGGVGIWVVSHRFLDKLDPEARKWISQHADFIGAIRLPNNAFLSNAGTKVVTDIVIFRKRADTAGSETGQAWQDVGTIKGEDGRPMRVNRWFVENPGMMLGTPTLGGKMYRRSKDQEEFTLDPIPGARLENQLAEAVTKLPEGIFTENAQRDVERLEHFENTASVPDVPVGSFFVDDKGEVRIRARDMNGARQSDAVTVKSPDINLPRIKGMIGIRDALRTLSALERNAGSSNAEIEEARKVLNERYDAYVKKHGVLNRRTNRWAFALDPLAPRLFALEQDFDPGVSRETAKRDGVKPRDPSAKKADIFNRRVWTPPMDVTSAPDSKSGLAISLNQRGRVDIGYIAALTGKSPEQVAEDIDGLAFETPSGEWETADSYLSGNVREKLAAAQEAARENPRFEANVAALKKVLPPDIPSSKIRAPIGASWLGVDTIREFIREITGIEPTAVLYADATGRWGVEIRPKDRQQALELNARWGTPDAGFERLVNDILNNRDTKIETRSLGSTVVLEEETKRAAEKKEQIKDKWESWVMGDPERALRLAKVYNEKFNSFAQQETSGDHLTLPGKTSAIQLLMHQLRVAWRTITQRVLLYDHVVGAGKTFAGIAAFMEMRRLGIVRKPLFVVPNHLTTQWRDDWIRLYPGANILWAAPSDFQKDKRERMFSRIANGDWDAVIIGHSSLKKLGMDPQSETEILSEQVAELITAIKEAKEETGNAKKDARFIKDLERRKEAIEAKIAKKLEKLKDRDQSVTFDELGIDGIFVDEAHEFKNLGYVTAMQPAPVGLGTPDAADKSFDLQVKLSWLRKAYGGKAPMVFATGTPISNSLLELFHMMRYLIPDRLKNLGISSADAFLRTFGDIGIADVVDASGTGFSQATVFKQFLNPGELAAIYRTFADTVSTADLHAQYQARYGTRFPTPKVKGGSPKNLVVPRTADQAAYFGIPDEDDNYPPGTILHRIENLPDDPKVDNMLTITTDARKAGLDMRLVDPQYKDDPGSKVHRAAKEIVRVYRENDYRSGTQLVFCDLSIPNSAKKKIKAQQEEEKKGVFWTRNKETGGFDEVPPESKPKEFTFENQPEGSEFFAYKTSTGYNVTERTTGFRVFFADTLKDAKERGRQIFATPATVERFKEQIAQNAAAPDAVSAFVESRLALRKEAEATEQSDDAADLDEEKSDKLTFDELMALKSDFSVYDDLKAKLVAEGIPEDQIQFIHDWDTPARKFELFRRMNSGQVRILIGSTPKIGAGTNVQRRLVALHHLDAPWRPSDLEQREGRIIRRGNEFYDKANPEAFQVEIFRYASDLTYDTKMWDIIERKAGGIENFKQADASVRELPDVRSEAANAAEMKAAASGNPLILEELNLRRAIDKARSKAKAVIAERADLKGVIHDAEVLKPATVRTQRERADQIEKIAKDNPAEPLKVKVSSPWATETFEDADKAKAALQRAVNLATETSPGKEIKVGRFTYRGVEVALSIYWTKMHQGTKAPVLEAHLAGRLNWRGRLGSAYNLVEDTVSFRGLLQRVDNFLDEAPKMLRQESDRIEAEAKATAPKAKAMLEEIKDPPENIPEMVARHAEVVAKLKNAKEERKKAREAAKAAREGQNPQGGAEPRRSTAKVEPLTEGAQAAIERVKDVVAPMGVDAEVVWEPGWVTYTPEGKPWPIAAKAASRGRPMQLNAAVMGRFTRAQIVATVEHEQTHPELATAWGVAQLGLFELTEDQIRFLQDAGYAQGSRESDADYAIRLKDEFVAHEAERNTTWWRNLLDKVREFLAKVGLATLSNQEIARRILRSIRRRRDDRAEDLLPEPIPARLSTGAGPVPRGTTSQQGKGKSAKEAARSLPAGDTGAPIQPGDRRAMSKAEFGAPAYIRQKAREREIFADNFIAQYGTLKEALGAVNAIEDSAFIAVTVGEIAARAAEDLGDPNRPGTLDPVDASRIVQRATQLLQAVKTDTAQGLQAQTQVNERLGAFRAVLSYLELIRTNQERVLGKKFPEVVSDNIRAWMRQSARIAVEAVAKQMKNPNTVVTKRLRAIAGAMEIPWTALFQSSWDTQRKVQEGMYRAMRQHPDLAKLPKAEVLELTNLFVRAWAKEHNAIFQAEFARAVRENGVKVTEPDMKRLVRALPRIVRWINLGLLDDEHFRQAVAPEFGIAALDDADVLRLSELAQEAQRTPEGVRRNRIYQKMVDMIVASQGIKTTDLLRDFWFANVLSGLRTWIDVGVGSWLAAFTMTARAAADLTVRGRPLLAYRTVTSLIRATGEGIANAADIIKTGDTARLPDTQARLWAVLSGKGRADSLEAAKRHGTSWQKALGLAAYVRRIMVGLDYVGQLGARDAMLIYAAASRGDVDSLAGAMRRFDQAETKRAEEQARAELGAKAKWVDVQARKREILEAGIAEEIKESAMTLGKVAALNADPVGFGGLMYRAISHLPWIARAPLGLSFARAAINMAQNATDWLPIAGLVNWGRARLADSDAFRDLPEKHPMRLFGLDVPVERRRLIAAAQLGGLALTAVAIGLFLDDDDDERLVDINGTWFGIDPKKKGQLLSQGERPLSIRIGETWISYKNTPFAAALAFVGNLRDKQRFRGESFDAESTAERLVNAWILGFLYIKDVSAMSQLSQVLGASAVDTRDELANANKAVASTIGNTLAGFIPGVSLLREIDTITDPNVYRPSGGFEAWIRNIPFARRAIGEGPAVNALGEEIEAPRMPWGRWMNERSDDPAWELLAGLSNQGVFLPVPSKTATIVDRRGNRRQMNGEEYYRYSIEAGRAWKEAIMQDRSFLRSANPGLARGWFESRTERIHKAARAKVKPTE